MQRDNAFIQQQANDWVVKLETGAMKDGDEDRFVEWLAQDDAHGQALQEAEETWRLMQEVPTESIVKIPTRKQPWLSLAASLLLVLLSSFWWQDIYYTVAADHYTATGQKTEHVLEDGSTLILNTDTAVQISFSSTRRLITLLQGELYIDVASDPSRPLSVDSGDLRVTALGTAFAVRNDRHRQQVTVVEHKVKVESKNASEKAATLSAGSQISMLESRNQFTSVNTINVDHETAWKQSRYVFKDQLLADVISEIDRYYAGRLVFKEAGLKDIRISGVLSLESPIDALKELAISAPIKVTQITPYWVTVERR